MNGVSTLLFSVTCFNTLLVSFTSLMDRMMVVTCFSCMRETSERAGSAQETDVSLLLLTKRNIPVKSGNKDPLRLNHWADFGLMRGSSAPHCPEWVRQLGAPLAVAHRGLKRQERCGQSQRQLVWKIFECQEKDEWVGQATCAQRQMQRKNTGISIK